MSDKPLSGELFTPSDDVLRRATVHNWDELAAKAGHDLEGFWAAEANELHWFAHWERVLDDRSRSTSGLSAAKPTSSTTVWIVMHRRHGATNLR